MTNQDQINVITTEIEQLLSQLLQLKKEESETEVTNCAVVMTNEGEYSLYDQFLLFGMNDQSTMDVLASNVSQSFLFNTHATSCELFVDSFVGMQHSNEEDDNNDK